MSGLSGSVNNHIHNHTHTRPSFTPTVAAAERVSTSTSQESRNTSQGNSPLPPPSYFEDAFNPSPSPPPSTSFLDNILNPISNYVPFASRSQDSLTARTPPSPVPNHFSTSSSFPMARSRPSQSSQLPFGFVDLTDDVDAPPRQPKRSTPTAEPSSKRQKRNDGPSRRNNIPPEAKIEEIDLSDEKVALRDTLEKQRADAVKAQEKPGEQATNFNTFTCVICMDTPTDITATSCGHLFCHTCLMEALIAGENRSAPGEPRRSQCPVCRKIIVRTKQADIIPLGLMRRGLATQPRKNSKTTAKAV